MTTPECGFEKPNHTQTPNTFFDVSLKEISSFPELKIVLAIIRKTFGWQKERDKISMSQLREITGLKQQSVQRGIELALEHGFITREASGRQFFYSLKLVTSGDQSHHVTSHTTLPKPVTRGDRKLVTPRDTQKKGIKEKKERVGHPRDPLLDNPHVVAYRDVCRLTANAEQRKLIAATVTDAALWNSVLRKFMAEGQKPQHVDWLIERYAKGNGSRTYVDAELARAVTPERIREMRDGR